MPFKILVINPGSTSTKVALFENESLQFETKIEHPLEQLKQYLNLWDQFDFRKRAIISLLDKNQIGLHQLSAVVGRGGLLKSIPGGTYLVNETMVEDARKGVQGQHAANLGCALDSAKPFRRATTQRKKSRWRPCGRPEVASDVISGYYV